MVFVHQFATGKLGFLLGATAVHVNLRTRAARAGITHFPEVIVFVAVENMVGRQMLRPDCCSLVVTREAIFLGAFKHRSIEVGGVYLQHIDDVFPGKVNRAFFEVIAERPVAQHLEHRVVVGIVADFLQVIMLARDAQTLLAVCHARVLYRVIAEDDTFPRVHAGIGKHQCRVIFDDHRSRGNDLMSLACHKIEK